MLSRQHGEVDLSQPSGASKLPTYGAHSLSLKSGSDASRGKNVYQPHIPRKRVRKKTYEVQNMCPQRVALVC